MSTFAFFLLCIQACLIQQAYSQILGGCGRGSMQVDAINAAGIANSLALGNGLGLAGINGFGVGGVGGLALAEASLNSRLGGLSYASGYGGVGNGALGVAGEMPVAGTTLVTGAVPVLGAVSFSGNLPAAGSVSISGNCGCGGIPYGTY